jgi:hypothetical protein
MTTRTILTTCLVAGALAGGILAPAAAHASGADAVRSSGGCSAGATWTVKAKHDDGRLEVEAEVDSNRAGQSWNWRISDNGTRVRSGSATTKAPSGSFTVQRRIADRTGVDHLVFRSSSPASGQTCRGTVSV